MWFGLWVMVSVKLQQVHISCIGMSIYSAIIPASTNKRNKQTTSAVNTTTIQVSPLLGGHQCCYVHLYFFGMNESRWSFILIQFSRGMEPKGTTCIHVTEKQKAKGLKNGRAAGCMNFFSQSMFLWLCPYLWLVDLDRIIRHITFAWCPAGCPADSRSPNNRDV